MRLISQYPLPITDAYLRELQLQNVKEGNGKEGSKDEVDASPYTPHSPEADPEPSRKEPIADPEVVPKNPSTSTPENPASTVPPENSTIPSLAPLTEEIEAQKDTPDVPTRFAEKKRLVWSDKTCTSAMDLGPRRGLQSH